MTIDREQIRATAKRYGFATVVIGVLALMTVLVLAKDLLGGNKAPGAGGAPGMQAAGGGAPGGKRPGGPGGAGGFGGGDMPVVSAAAVEQRVFSDALQALGTAQARESITITSKVQDVIRRINFESGQHVAKGQVLIELASVEQQADLKESRAQLVADKATYDRIKALFDRGFSPRAQLDQAQAAYGRSQAQVAAGESRIADRSIRAPFAGVVGLREASPGQLASPGQTLGTLDDTTIIKLDFDVPESQLSKMKKGAPLEARSAAFANAVFDGRIDDVDTRVNTQTRTVKVRALIGNKDGRIKPGMLMTVNVLSNQKPALSIPEMALTEVDQDAFVYTVAEKGGAMKVAQVYIKPGRRTDGFIEVLDGLNAGDKVITEGLQRVRPGQTVKLKGPGIAPPGSAPGAKPGKVGQSGGVAPKTVPEAMGGGGAFARGRS